MEEEIVLESKLIIAMMSTTINTYWEMKNSKKKTEKINLALFRFQKKEEEEEDFKEWLINRNLQILMMKRVMVEDFIMKIYYLYHNLALRSVITDLNKASLEAQMFPFSFTVFFSFGL